MGHDRRGGFRHGRRRGCVDGARKYAHQPHRRPNRSEPQRGRVPQARLLTSSSGGRNPRGCGNSARGAAASLSTARLARTTRRRRHGRRHRRALHVAARRRFRARSRPRRERYALRARARTVRVVTAVVGVETEAKGTVGVDSARAGIRSRAGGSRLRIRRLGIAMTSCDGHRERNADEHPDESLH